MNLLSGIFARLAGIQHWRRFLAILLAPLVFQGCASLGVKSAYLDATEVGTSFPTSVPANTQLYTKIAGVAFSVDVLAGVYMTNNTSIQNSVYVGFPYFSNIYAQGDSNIDIVDLTKSGGSCGTVGDGNQVSGVTISTSGVGSYGGSNSGYYSWSGSEYGRKTYTFTSPQAVAKAKIRIYGNNSSQGVSATSCSTDAFTIRPASLVITSSPASTATQVAGSTYTMYATAMNGASTAVTTTGYTGTPVLTTTNITDWSTTIGAGSFTGSFGAASSGVSSGSFAYNNFGQLTIPAGAVVDSTYVSNSGSGDVSGGDCISGSSSNTLSGGMYGCNIGNAAANTPRFIPHHYSVTHTVTPACANKFTYFGQSLTMTTTVDAYNASSGKMTRLTEGASNKPSFTWTQTNSGSATTSPITIPTSNLKWSADSTYNTSSGGSYFTSTTTSTPYSAGAVAATTTRPSVTPPASASSPPDYESFNLTFNTSDALITSCNGVWVSSYACSATATVLRYGVLKLADGQATSLTPATMQVTAQYWNGSAFVTNTDDSCTTLNFNAGTIAKTGSPTLTLKNSSTTLSSGVGALMLSTTAATTLAVKLGASDNNCISASSSAGTPLNSVSAYLGGVSCATSYDKDPSASVLFGTLRAPYVYRAEKF